MRFVEEVKNNGLEDKMHIVYGDYRTQKPGYDEFGFYSRYEECRKIIKKYIKENQNVDLV